MNNNPPSASPLFFGVTGYELSFSRLSYLCQLSINSAVFSPDHSTIDLKSIPSRLSLFHFPSYQNNPRMASVVASVPSICLSLSKTVFRNALSEDSFAAVLSTVLAQRRKARKRRQTASKNRLVSGKHSLIHDTHMCFLRCSDVYQI